MPAEAGGAALPAPAGGAGGGALPVARCRPKAEVRSGALPAPPEGLDRPPEE